MLRTCKEISEAFNYEQIMVADVRLDHRVAAHTFEEGAGKSRRVGLARHIMRPAGGGRI